VVDIGFVAATTLRDLSAVTNTDCGRLHNKPFLINETKRESVDAYLSFPVCSVQSSTRGVGQQDNVEGNDEGLKRMHETSDVRSAAH
jgi:hypothetical protein